MQNLKIKSTTNTNSNKIIGIFAKKGPIYCSQYYCRQIMIGLLLTTGSWHIPPVSHSDYSRSSNSGGLFDFSVTPGSFYSLSYWQWQLLNVEYDLDLDLVLDLGAYLELDNTYTFSLTKTTLELPMSCLDAVILKKIWLCLSEIKLSSESFLLVFAGTTFLTMFSLIYLFYAFFAFSYCY